MQLQAIFSYPIIRPMDIVPSSGDFALLQMDSDLVPCILEPPWIKRCSYGVKFTDEINVLDSIGSNTDETEEKNNKVNAHSSNFKKNIKI